MSNDIYGSRSHHKLANKSQLFQVLAVLIATIVVVALVTGVTFIYKIFRNDISFVSCHYLNHGGISSNRSHNKLANKSEIFQVLAVVMATMVVVVLVTGVTFICQIFRNNISFVSCYYLDLNGFSVKRRHNKLADK